MKNEKYWIWLSRIENLNKRKLDILLGKYKSLERLWSVTDKNELSLPGITENLAKKIVSKEYKENLDKYIEYMKKHNIEILTFESKYYPRSLYTIYDPPISLYIKGNKEILNNKSIAIVGCRECTKYGENTAKKFAYDLGIANINIVSGLARGIDASAHLGAIYSKGKTVAVVRFRTRYSLSKRKQKTI